MPRLEEILNEAILDTAAHASKAMILLDRFRQAADPELAEAYQLVHGLMGDLVAVLTCAQLLDESPSSLSPAVAAALRG